MVFMFVFFFFFSSRRRHTILVSDWSSDVCSSDLIQDVEKTFFIDIVRVDEEGFFHVLDRKKDMIIRSGLKVFPAKVEKVLKSHPLIIDAAVVGRSDPKQTEMVVAVVVAKAPPEKNEKGQPTDRNAYLEKLSDELRALCREHLAPYEVPRLFEFADSLPRSPLGKLLKRELRKAMNGHPVISTEK